VSAAAPGLADLVSRARDPALPLAQRHAAFERLVERSRRAVLGHAVALLLDREEAEDAAQETYLVAWQRLGQLRHAAAFTAWVCKIVENRCRRRLRTRPRERPVDPPTHPEAAAPDADQSLVAEAVAGLPPGEREAAVLFYYFGCTQEEVARRMKLKPGTVGKRLHSARLKIRRRLPASVRERFVRLAPTPRFRAEIRRGLHQEYVGEYRFAERPEHVVSIRCEGDLLVADAAGQRTVLALVSADALVTGAYDGLGRFARDRRGRVTHFVYYEFGRRLGVARKTNPRRRELAAAPASRSRHGDPSPQ
jgi:RNA polymerase sigma factor (sigma-70 family)